MDEKIVKDSQGLVKNLVNDTISRQAAIEAIKEDKIDLTNTNVVAVFKATGDFEKVETQVMTCDRHIKILKDLPSAQPERKRGKWIPHSEKCREYIGTVLVNVEYGYWFCDACGYRVEKGQPMYNFCPNCGADMREVDDERPD